MTMSPTMSTLITALKKEGHAPWQVMHWLHDDLDGLFGTTSIILSQAQLQALESEPAPALADFAAAWGQTTHESVPVPEDIARIAQNLYTGHGYTLAGLFCDWACGVFDLRGEGALAVWLGSGGPDAVSTRLMALWHQAVENLTAAGEGAPVA